VESRPVIVQDTQPARVGRIEPLVFAAATALVLPAIIFPRSAAAMIAIPVVGAFAFLATRKSYAGLSLPFAPVLLWLLAFAGWSMTTAIWSTAPGASLTKPLFLVGAVLGAAVLSLMAERLELSFSRAATNGIVVAALAGGVLIAIESMTHQGISRFLMTEFSMLRQGLDKHVVVSDNVVLSITDANLKRRCTVFTMLIVPAAAILSQISRPRWRLAGLAMLATLAVIVVRYSGHQSSQVAIAAAGVCFALATLSRVWALRAVAAAWIFACLLAAPLVTAAHKAGLHTASWLPTTSQHRIVIWNTTAQEIWKAPILGIGADATATQTLKKEASNETKTKSGAYDVTTARHAHNAYLQVWYELGLAGLLIFMGAGLTALSAIGRLQPGLQPYFIAQFAAFAALIAFSFSIWQLWFQAAIGLGAITLLVFAAMDRHKRDTR
jgi:O-antigen ligase